MHRHGWRPARLSELRLLALIAVGTAFLAMLAVLRLLREGYYPYGRQAFALAVAALTAAALVATIATIEARRRRFAMSHLAHLAYRLSLTESEAEAPAQHATRTDQEGHWELTDLATALRAAGEHALVDEVAQRSTPAVRRTLTQPARSNNALPA